MGSMSEIHTYYILHVDIVMLHTTSRQHDNLKCDDVKQVIYLWDTVMLNNLTKRDKFFLSKST